MYVKLWRKREIIFIVTIKKNIVSLITEIKQYRKRKKREFIYIFKQSQLQFASRLDNTSCCISCSDEIPRVHPASINIYPPREYDISLRRENLIWGKHCNLGYQRIYRIYCEGEIVGELCLKSSVFFIS